MHHYQGQCHCKNTQFTLSLPHRLVELSPRQCNCDFCMARNIHYLSDPNGVLKIHRYVPLAQQRQGSDQASFLTRSVCNAVVAVTYETNQTTIGSVNACLLNESSSLNAPTMVTPKTLSAREKVKRWQAMWLVVEISQMQVR